MAPAKLQPLAGSAFPRHPSSQFVQQVDADEDVTFTIFVRQRPDGPALPSLEDYSQTPFHGGKILSLDEYTNLYGASLEDLNAVVAVLEGSRMTIVDQHVGARTLTVRGTAAQIASTFGVVLNVYQSPTPMATLRRKPAGRKPSAETEIHIGYDSDISVPSKLAEIITHIVGLDTRSISAPGTASGDPGVPGPTASVFRTVNNMAGIYNFPQNLTATDQTVGIFNAGGSYLASDITQHFAPMPAGFNTPPSIVDVPLKVGSSSYQNQPNTVRNITNINATPPNAGTAPGADLEITSDIQIASTTAQGCTVNVYFTDTTAQGWIVFLNRILFPQFEKQPTTVTISWIVFDETVSYSATSTRRPWTLFRGTLWSDFLSRDLCFSISNSKMLTRNLNRDLALLSPFCSSNWLLWGSMFSLSPVTGAPTTKSEIQARTSATLLVTPG